jgi:hypothetical protein
MCLLPRRRAEMVPMGGPRRMTRHTPLVRPLAAAALALFTVLASRSAQATTSCSFDGKQQVEVQLLGAPIRVSVDDVGQVLVDDVPCGSPGGTNATVNSSLNVDITGTIGVDIVTIDEMSGPAFPSSVSFSINLDEDPGDQLSILASGADDEITLKSFAVFLDFSEEGYVGISGVDLLEIDGNAGADTIQVAPADSEGDQLQIPVILRGGQGDDTLTGGPMNDQIYGNENDDVLDGSDGTDFLNGGRGVDTCRYIKDFASCDPTLEIQPPEGEAGTPATASGLGWFPENGPIEVSYPGPTTVISVQPEPDGRFVSDAFDIPPGGSGVTVKVTACQHCSDSEPVRRTGEFQYSALVLPTVTLTPRAGSVGQTVEISGSGWRVNEPVSLFLDPKDVTSESPFATATADGHGLFAAFFDLPDSVGRRLLVACQLCGSSDELRVPRHFRIVASIGAATLRLSPERAASGGDVHLVGTGFRPDLGAVTFSVESGGAVTPMSGTALVGPDGGFDVTVRLPDLDAGTYLVKACQRCSTPGELGATSALTVASVPARWPWVAGAALVVVALAAGSMLWRRRLRRPRDRGPQDGSGDIVRAHARPSIPVVTVGAEPGAGPGHTIRLVPHPDPGTQRVEELIDR